MTPGASVYYKGQGMGVKFWGGMGCHQKTGDTKLFMTTLPPQDKKKRRVRKKNKHGKYYKRTVKNNSSVSMTSDRFCKMVKNNFVPWAKALGFDMRPTCPKDKKPIIVLDGETAINTPEANKALKKAGFLRAKHPKSSPDLNAVETAWSRLKDMVYDIKKFPSKIPNRNEWVKKVHNCLKKVNKTDLNAIGYKSMKTRAKDILKVDGHRSRW